MSPIIHPGRGIVETRRAFQQLRFPPHSDGYDNLTFSAGALTLGQIAYITESETLAILSQTGTWQGNRTFGAIGADAATTASLFVTGKQIVLLEGATAQYKGGDRLFQSATDGSASRNWPSGVAVHVYQVGFFSEWFDVSNSLAYVNLNLGPKRQGA